MTKSLRIAIADDEPDMRDYFAKILPRLGHQVVALAENGAELLRLCRSAHPDLVITDIKMPDMDGIDAAIKIYQEEQIPVILVSAYYDPALIRRAEAAGTKRGTGAFRTWLCAGGDLGTSWRKPGIRTWNWCGRAVGKRGSWIANRRRR